MASGRANPSWKHGLEGTATYNAWASMLSRCRNPRNKWFHRYGGRGIGVCARWHDFANFLADMGEKPAGLSLDRIDNDRNYEPDNCRWASHTAQMRNRAVTVFVEHQGERVAVSELAERFGLKPKLLRERLARGLSVEAALSRVRHGRWGATSVEVRAA